MSAQTTNPNVFGFERWVSPWTLADLTRTNASGEQDITAWVRTYQQRSECGVPGCCETIVTIVGPEVQR